MVPVPNSVELPSTLCDRLCAPGAPYTLQGRVPAPCGVPVCSRGPSRPTRCRCPAPQGRPPKRGLCAPRGCPGLPGPYPLPPPPVPDVPAPSGAAGTVGRLHGGGGARAPRARPGGRRPRPGLPVARRRAAPLGLPLPRAALARAARPGHGPRARPAPRARRAARAPARAGGRGESATGRAVTDEQVDPHVPGGVPAARGDPAARPQLPTLFHQDLRGAAPEEGALAGGLYDGLQQTIQNPGAGSATDAGIPCLCLAPTYELALQIGQVVRTIGKFCTDIKVNYAVRGNRVLKGTVLEEQIIIGTPGTTLDWCFKQRILDLTKISLFVLDEADIMIDTQGLSCQSIRIHRALPKSCQVLLFSATYKEPVRAFAERIIPDPIVIKLREEELTLSNIRQYFMVCQSSDEQYKALCNLYGSFTIGQVMIFCQTRRLADWLSGKMSRDGHQVAILTAELTVVQRASVIQRFREGKEKVLIATNVCARGIDVQQVTTVVNFGLPVDQDGEPDFETYLHRIGRAGRFGHRGIAFSVVQRETVRLVHKIEEYFQTTIKQLDPYDMDELEKLAAE